ncbi:MAG: ABC transporter substrate-binding protein [bacterium]|nr:ABC transporter substrate-binding protein [bacterium]
MSRNDNNQTGIRFFAPDAFNRRQVLAGSASAAALATGMGNLVATPGTAKADTPKKGGRLRLGITDSSSDETLDMNLATTIVPGVSAGALYNNLVEVDANNEPIPELAEGWEASADAKRWVFALRRGVEFHTGKTMTAEDVVFSLNRHRGEDSQSANKAMFADVTDITADDDHTVAITLANGNADFPFILSDWRSPIYAAGTTDFDLGIGTGGYELVSFEPGIRISLKRNPNYWKEGRAHFDEVEVLGVNDGTARNTALISGEVDVINSPNRQTFADLVATPGLQGIEAQGFAHYTMPMRADTAPFDNNDVRLALKYALDREQLLRIILSGHGAVGNDHPISPANRFFASELEQRTYDPDKAKFHVKQAGLDSLKVQLSASPSSWGGASAIDAVAIFRESAAEAGIDIEIVAEPADGYWSNVWLNKPFCTSYWFGRESEDAVFSLTYAAGAPQNESFWADDRFQSLLFEARAELDVAKRRDMYVEMQQILHETGGSIIPLFNNNLLAANDKVRFGKVAGNRQLDGLRLIERWWMA